MADYREKLKNGNPGHFVYRDPDVGNFRKTSEERQSSRERQSSQEKLLEKHGTFDWKEAASRHFEYCSVIAEAAVLDRQSFWYADLVGPHEYLKDAAIAEGVAWAYATRVEQKPCPKLRQAIIGEGNVYKVMDLAKAEGPHDDTRNYILSEFRSYHNHYLEHAAVLEYARIVDNKPRKDTRDRCLSSSESAYLYARHVDKKPRNDTRRAACLNPTFALEYGRFVDIEFKPYILKALSGRGSLIKEYARHLMQADKKGKWNDKERVMGRVRTVYCKAVKARLGGIAVGLYKQRAIMEFASEVDKRSHPETLAAFQQAGGEAWEYNMAIRLYKKYGQQGLNAWRSLVSEVGTEDQRVRQVVNPKLYKKWHDKAIEGKKSLSKEVPLIEKRTEEFKLLEKTDFQGVAVKPLIGFSDFEAEGKLMEHCIYQYRDDRSSNFIHLESDKQSATLQVRGKKQLQFKSQNNGPVYCEKLLEAARQITELLP